MNINIAFAESFIQILCFLQKALKSSIPSFTKYLVGAKLETFGRHFHKDCTIAAMGEKKNLIVNIGDRIAYFQCKFEFRIKRKQDV